MILTLFAAIEIIMISCWLLIKSSAVFFKNNTIFYIKRAAVVDIVDNIPNDTLRRQVL